MSHIEDRWTVPGPTGRRVKSAHHSQGLRWVAVWEEAGGKRRRQRFVTKDAATAKLAQVAVQLAEGTYIAAGSGRSTLADYAQVWMSEQIHQRGATTYRVAGAWRVHILPTLGRYRLEELTRARVQAAVGQWSATLAPSTIKATVFPYLVAAMNAATADRLIATNPCRGVRLPKVELPRVVPVTVQQVHQIAGNVPERYRAMVHLAAATGMRQGELCGLTIDRLQIGSQSVVIRIDRQLSPTPTKGPPVWGPPKTARGDRTVTEGPQLAAILRRHIADFPPHPSGLIFTTASGLQVGRSTMARTWNRARAGVVPADRSGWHELRHFNASLLIAKGLSAVAVAERLGDRPDQILRTYAHLWPSDESRAQAAVADVLWAGSPTQSPTLTIVAGHERA